MKFTVQIFARYPRLGQVKTRLAATLGDDIALELHCELVERQLNEVARLPVRVGCELWCTEAANEPWCADVFKRYPRLRYRRQVSGALGIRMETALKRGMQYSCGIVQIGTDCPVLNAAHMQLCMEELENGSDSVLIAAEDGGYVLAAYSSFQQRLYCGVDWGTERVLAQTLERHRQVGMTPVVYSSLWDVDHAEDYERYRLHIMQNDSVALQRGQAGHG